MNTSKRRRKPTLPNLRKKISLLDFWNKGCRKIRIKKDTRRKFVREIWIEKTMLLRKKNMKKKCIKLYSMRYNLKKILYFLRMTSYINKEKSCRKDQHLKQSYFQTQSNDVYQQMTI